MVTPGSTVDATRVLDLVDVGDREDLRLGLRSVLVTRVEDSPTFEEVFDAFWGGGRRPSRNPAVIPPEPPASTEERGARTLARWMRGEGELAEESVQVPGPSAQEALGTQDFTTFGDETLRAVTALARRIARRLRAGQVKINYPAWDTFAPFGGYKQSGNGREYADWAIHDFLEVKALIGFGTP